MAADRMAAFRRDVAALAGEALVRAASDDRALAGLLEAVEDRVQGEAGRLRTGDTPPPACARGCAACCTVNVGTLALEGAAAAAWLRSQVPSGRLPGLAADLLRFHSSVRWQDDGERVRSRARCPLLDPAGCCSIHPARPLACRALTSLDAGECRAALRERADEDGPGLVRMDLVQKALYDEASAELAQALVRRGLDARRRDVSGMTGAFLADPAGAAAFAAGGRVPLE